MDITERDVLDAILRYDIRISDCGLEINPVRDEPFSAEYIDEIDEWRIYWNRRSVTYIGNDTWLIDNTGGARLRLDKRMWLQLMKLVYFMRDMPYTETDDDDGSEMRIIDAFPYGEDEDTIRQFVTDAFSKLPAKVG